MKTKHFLALFILTFLIFGALTIVLINAPFGLLFYLCIYLSIIGLIIALIIISYLLIKSKRILIKVGGILTIILTTILLMGVILITYDYRILYFKSPISNPTKIEWQEDLSYLSSQMRTIHPDIYSMISKSSLDSLENEIKERIPNSDDSDILMDLFQFTAAPNDAHTFPFIFFPCFDLHNFPIQIYDFPDGWYVVEAGRGYKELIGSKIINIESQDIDDIFEKYPVFLGVENKQSRKERFTYMVAIPEWLKYHKIVDDINNVNFTFESQDGEQFIKTLPSYKYYLPFIWSSIMAIENEKPHVFTNPRKNWYQFTSVNDNTALYIEYHQCDNQPGKETVAEFALNLEQHLANSDYEHYIIDLRSNDGGNSNVNGELIRVIRDSEYINQSGKLFVLIGRRTFSAAVMFANQLQMQTDALFVGEATSQGPIFFGQPNLIELPNSKLVIGVSSNHTIGGLPFDNRTSIEPDIKVEYSIEDFLNNRDPAIDMVFNNIIKNTTQPIMDNAYNIEGKYLLSPRDFVEIYLLNGNLHLEISDFVPNSMVRFNSKLSPDDINRFRTKIKNVSLGIEFENSKKQLVLNWMGIKNKLEKVSEDNQWAMKSLLDGEIETGVTKIDNNQAYYKELYNDLEQILNRLGYQLMGQDKLADAVKVFELNVELYPESSNVYDSLAESYMNNEEFDLAIEFYNKSLELNPNNNNAIKMLKQMK